MLQFLHVFSLFVCVFEFVTFLDLECDSLNVCSFSLVFALSLGATVNIRFCFTKGVVKMG